jgi:hypothetical protein
MESAGRSAQVRSRINRRTDLDRFAHSQCVIEGDHSHTKRSNGLIEVDKGDEASTDGG